jgi:catechol 2,3-dioxygenase-like lactoylglutathione lyase family enzyme
VKPRATLALLLLLVLAAASPAARAAEVSAVESVGFTVADLDREVAFLTRVLGFEKLSESALAGDGIERLQGVAGARARVARLRLGDETIELTEYLAPRGRAYPADSRSQDRWFQHVAIVTPDMARAHAHLRAHAVEPVSAGPQRLPDWNPNAGGIEAFYFEDPEGHVLEVIAFPPGKGDPKWRAAAAGAGDRLFLGIDHTAIVVSDTDASLRFWRDELELRVAGESENHGSEQEHLNAVFGARLRITALRAASGPGIELLEYLAPRDGRARPADARANDLLHWQTSVVAPTPARLTDALRAARAPFLSPGLVVFPRPALGFGAAALVQDPDGHAVRIVDATPAKEQP